MTEAKAKAHTEREIKLTLGGEREFVRWRELLGQPQRVQNQLNFYFSIQEADPQERAMLRVRAHCHADCASRSADCSLSLALTDPTLPLERCPLCTSDHTAFILTYKRGLDLSAGYFQATELETPLTQGQLRAIFAGDLGAIADTIPGHYFSERHYAHCQFQGTLANTRLCYPRPQGETWELDLSHFGATRCDCELEVETEERQRVMEEIEELAQRAQLSYGLQTQTKYERFLLYGARK